jgi:lipopolysaccharide/colanic/teichoic acid biosynthesis glycosyltransferase
MRVAASGRSPDLRFIAIARPRAWVGGVTVPVSGGRIYRALKRMIDIVLVLLAMPFALPLMALSALAVRLDSQGSPFFTQLRTGRGGRQFRMFKLRTMVHNASELKQQYAHLNELSWPDFKITDDPRVTRVGRFLRRTSLDELPQLFNVLRGDMTLVGPRPTSFSADTYRLWHTTRLEVQPGLTGLWQVSGRNELDFDDRLRLDIAYIRNRSLKLDLLILFKTFSAVFSGRGAS